MNENERRIQDAAEILYRAALEFAKRVARRMLPKDDEGESIAGLAAFKALKAWKEERGVPLNKFISHCVRMDILYYIQRQRRKPEVEWDDASVEFAMSRRRKLEEPNFDASQLDPDTWQLLVEFHIERKPLDVIGRRYGRATRYAVRKMVRRAEEKLMELRV